MPYSWDPKQGSSPRRLCLLHWQADSFLGAGGSLIHKLCISSREQMEKNLVSGNLVGRKEASVYRRMAFK